MFYCKGELYHRIIKNREKMNARYIYNLISSRLVYISRLRAVEHICAEFRFLQILKHTVKPYESIIFIFRFIILDLFPWKKRISAFEDGTKRKTRIVFLYFLTRSTPFLGIFFLLIFVSIL